MVNLIVAVDKSNSIGWSNGDLPWKIPVDMARFKALTMGNDIMMGWNTFKSLGRPEGLPGRKNFVVTSKDFDTLAWYWGINPQTITKSAAKWRELPVNIYNDMFQFVVAHQAGIGSVEVPELWIIGGAQIYHQAIEYGLVDRICLTQVHTDSKADVKFRHAIYDYEKFIEDQALKGYKWEVESIETPTVLVGAGVTFVNLKKV